MKNSRRMFVLGSASLAGGLALSRTALAAPLPALAESDPLATSLGYKNDASQVDHAKFPQYAAGQMCSACALYSGKAGDASGPCAIFTGKAVSAKGWCASFSKR